MRNDGGGRRRCLKEMVVHNNNDDDGHGAHIEAAPALPPADKLAVFLLHHVSHESPGSGRWEFTLSMPFADTDQACAKLVLRTADHLINA